MAPASAFRPKPIATLSQNGTFRKKTLGKEESAETGQSWAPMVGQSWVLLDSLSPSAEKKKAAKRSAEGYRLRKFEDFLTRLGAV